jgi:putative lipoic acid-binding regulatory protein
MKQTSLFLVVAALASLSLFSCKKTMNESADEVSSETLTQIGKLGFSKANVIKTDGGYIVEGDIFLTDEKLKEVSTSPNLRIGGEEQYRTFNLVKNFPRTITVSVTGSVSAAFSTAVNNALARYNAESLGLTFQRVSSGGNIVIRIVNTGQYIASAGFPTSSGDPYNEIKYAKMYSNYSDGFMTTVIAHELGHCIGFRHTDYMNRAYSCGSGGNEGQESSGVGAVHIPGTATGPDAGSWMLACLGSNTNRPFTTHDKVALDYLY